MDVFGMILIYMIEGGNFVGIWYVSVIEIKL